jgi:hypothetical protein
VSCNHPKTRRFWTWNYPNPEQHGTSAGGYPPSPMWTVCAEACRCGRYRRPYGDGKWLPNPILVTPLSSEAGVA